MKKIIMILLTILLAAAMLAVPVSAEEQVFSIHYNAVTAPGETVIMTVSMAELDNVIALGATFSGDPIDEGEYSKWLLNYSESMESLNATEAMYGLIEGETVSGDVLQLALTIPEDGVKSEYRVAIEICAIIASSDPNSDPTSVYGELEAVINTSNPATDITVSNSQVQLGLLDNNTVQLIPVVIPADHTDTLTWFSHNTEVATVDENGFVTAVGEGEVKITVTAGSVQKNCLITVIKCGHTNRESVLPEYPTCTTAGKLAHDKCLDCGALLIYNDYGEEVEVEEENLIVPAPGHQYDGTWMKNEEEHYQLCWLCEKEMNRVEAHTFKWVEDGDGFQHEECTVCGFTRNEGTEVPQKQNIHVCVSVEPATYTIGAAQKPVITFVVTKNGELIEENSEAYAALGLGYEVNGGAVAGDKNTLENALKAAGTYTINPFIENEPADSIVTYENATLEVVQSEETGYKKAYFKTTYRIKLIEPWAMNINVRIVDEASNTIDYGTVKDYGVYAIRRDQMTDPENAVANMAIEDLKAEPNVIHFTKEDGTAVQEGQYVSIIFSEGLYTYRLKQDVIWALYYETDAGIFATEVKERKLYDLMNERKDSTSSTYSTEEKATYADMVELYDRVTDYRSDFTNLNDIVLQNTATMATTDIPFAAAAADGKYGFARVQQIGLIEPWGMRLNSRIYTSENTKGVVDYNTLTDYGVIVYHDKAGAVNAENLNEPAELLNFTDKAKTYVFSDSQGTTTISGKYASSIFNDSIYTYELDSTLYYMFFAQDGDNFYYSQVYATNIKTLAAERAVSQSTTYSEKEKRTYAAMVELCDSVAAYREWYQNRVGE